MKYYFMLMLLLCAATCIPFAHAWEFGIFAPGESYHYTICDNITRDAFTATASKCYDMQMRVIENVKMDSGYVWIMHVIMNGSDHDLVLLDENFDVTSLHNRYIEESLSSTLFWLPDDSLREFDPVIGDILGSVPSKFKDAEIIVADFLDYDEGQKEYSILWTNEYENQIWIREGVALPVRASVYSEIHAGFGENLAHSYDLKSYVSSEEYLFDLLSSVRYPDDAFVDDAFVDDAFVDDAFVDDAFVDDAFVDDAFVDDAFVDDAFVDDAFVDDAFVDDAFVDDTFVDDTFVDDTFVDDTFVDDTFVDDTFVDDTFENEVLSDEEFYGADFVGDDLSADEPSHHADDEPSHHADDVLSEIPEFFPSEIVNSSLNDSDVLSFSNASSDLKPSETMPSEPVDDIANPQSQFDIDPKDESDYVDDALPGDNETETLERDAQKLQDEDEPFGFILSFFEPLLEIFK